MPRSSIENVVPSPSAFDLTFRALLGLVFIEDNAILMPVLKVRKSLPPRQGLPPECRVERSYDRLNAVGSRSGSALSQRDQFIGWSYSGEFSLARAPVVRSEAGLS